ncbi:YEATS domain-containing protein 4 [Chytridiales sp. JEL 0842]|nr:YEATS domain-containing protein 4 [Chytridiales sp. JEL 0842]
MVTSQRLKNVTISRPIVYGTIAIPITKKDPPPDDPSHTHRWTVYARGPNNEDISHWVKKVSFKLHESFTPQTRVIDKPPFEVTETGWGEFEILIKVTFHDTSEKPQQLYHQLLLYPKDEVSIAAASAAPRNEVISEKYEEMVFNEPSEDMYEALNKEAPQHLTHSLFNANTEAREIKKYREVNELILAEIEKYSARSAKAEEKVKALQAEIRVLEGAPQA